MSSDPTLPRPPSLVNSEASLPLARVKRIVRLDPDIALVSADANYLIAKSAVCSPSFPSSRHADEQELFIEHLVQSAFENTQKNRRKVIKYDDLGISEQDGLFPHSQLRQLRRRMSLSFLLMSFPGSEQ